MLELLFNVHINDAFPHAPPDRALFACQIRLMELVYATFLNWFFMLPYTKSTCTFTVLLPKDVLLFCSNYSLKKGQLRQEILAREFHVTTVPSFLYTGENVKKKNYKYPFLGYTLGLKRYSLDNQQLSCSLKAVVRKQLS